MRYALMAAVAVAAAGCSFDPSGSTEGSDAAAADAAPGAADAAEAPADASGTCEPRCEGATLVQCAGNVEQPVDCEAGCSEQGGPHCGALVPANGVAAGELDGVDGALLVAADDVVRVWAATGQIDRNGVAIRVAGEGVLGGIRYIAGPPYNVFVFDDLDVANAGYLEVRGSLTSPVVFLVRDAVVVNGLINVSGGLGCPELNKRCGGPGAGNGGSSAFMPGGCAAGGAGVGEGGGGGGALGQDGAAGGAADTSAGGAGGAASACGGEGSIPLIGGSGGDAGGTDVTPSGGGVGGGGGGALQLTSLVSITIARDGTGGQAPGVWAAGAGGQGVGFGSGGGGGGSGGAVLLEAPVVELGPASILAANGGGGGEGAGTGDGADGVYGLQPATGGGGTVEGHGGAGGYGTTAPTAGDPYSSGGGGGGGGAGRIHIRTRPSGLTAEGTTSPPIHWTEIALD